MPASRERAMANSAYRCCAESSLRIVVAQGACRHRKPRGRSAAWLRRNCVSATKMAATARPMPTIVAASTSHRRGALCGSPDAKIAGCWHVLGAEAQRWGMLAIKNHIAAACRLCGALSAASASAARPRPSAGLNGARLAAASQHGGIRCFGVSRLRNLRALSSWKW